MLAEAGEGEEESGMTATGDIVRYRDRGVQWEECKSDR